MKKNILTLLLVTLSIIIMAKCSEPTEIPVTYATNNCVWANETIYFVMIDRFYNANTGNDVQTTNGIEFGTDAAQWSGGDFEGLTLKLDYIKDMGFTAIWITPPVENQWWDESIPYGGYHGYWASSFTNVDPHFGTLQDYKDFVDAAHAKGIKVIQDIVLNHTANYFTMDAEKGNLTVNSNGYPMYPSDPFLSNSIAYYIANGTNSMTDDLYAFHWNPDITIWSDWYQLTNYQASSLDDLNSENPVVVEKLKDWYNYWVTAVGIDGVRIDTCKNVPKELLQDFCYSTDADHPGMIEYARRNGKNNFIMFGEVWTPGVDNEDELAGSFTKDENGDPILDSVIYFPMFSVVDEMISKGENTGLFKTLIDNLDVYYRSDSIYKLVSFIDNHDGVRFWTGNDMATTKLALQLIYTSIGIPCVYYGTEQEFTMPRATMFLGGYVGDMADADYFDQTSEMYLFIKNLNSMRQHYEILRKGTQDVILWDDDKSGIMIFKREYLGKTATVIFNTATAGKYGVDMPTGYTNRTNLINILDTTEKVSTETNGTLTSTIPAQTCIILVPEEEYNAF